jgi:16S rRNA G527 N7-methylase RsmG
MTFKQMTTQNLERLSDKLKQNKKEYKLIEGKTNKEMWLSDLSDLKLLF